MFINSTHDSEGMDSKSKTACFTGHRTIKQSDLPPLMQKLEETILSLINQGIIYFGSGGATGFDQLAAFAVLKARKENPTIKLIMVLPCKDQDGKWNEADKQAYRHILENADKTVYVSDGDYYDGCMEKRNQHLIRFSQICVAFMKRGRSGTSQTVRIAREQGLTIINLAEN